MTVERLEEEMTVTEFLEWGFYLKLQREEHQKQMEKQKRGSR